MLEKFLIDTCSVNDNSETVRVSIFSFPHLLTVLDITKKRQRNGGEKKDALRSEKMNGENHIYI